MTPTRPRSPRLVLALLPLMLSLAACSDDGPGERDGPDAADALSDGAGGDTAADLDDADVIDLVEGDADAGPSSTIPRTPRVLGEDGEGADDVEEPLSRGDVRAGRVATFNHGFEGVEVDCRPGDFKIYNDRVAFCIADARPVNLWTYSGGHVTDVVRIRDESDRFFAHYVNNAFQLAGAETVEVVSDGENGLAVVRVQGGEEPLRLAYDLVGVWLPERGVILETEYRLRPDVDYLEIVTWVASPNRRQPLSAGDLVLFGDTTRIFFPGFGRARPSNDDSYERVVAHGPGQAYGYYAPTGMRNLALDIDELGADLPAVGLVLGGGFVEAGEEGVIQRYLLVGDGGTNGLREQIYGIDEVVVPDTGMAIRATLAGEPQSNLPIVISLDDVPIELLVTDAAGLAEIPLPVGEYTLTVEDWVGGAIQPRTIDVAGNDLRDVAIGLPEPAYLDVGVTAVLSEGADPVASPAKIELFGPRPERFYSIDGSLQAMAAPGDYRLVVSRGEAFSAVSEEITLVAGGTLSRAVALERHWDTGGLISGEFHQHMTRSIDSEVPELDRLYSNIVEGVDFVVPSDHDSITDYFPLLVEHDLRDLIYSMPSSEVSPIAAHFGAMPMPFEPVLPAGGAIPLAERLDTGLADIKTVPELVAELRADYGVDVIQLNHPRSNSALFETTDYDPLLGPSAVDDTQFSTDFDTIEVLNNSDAFCAVFTDWLSLVARGERVTGVGNTDTHSLNDLAGWPRNYLASDALDGEGATPRNIDDDDITNALLAGQVTVSRGALIDFPGGPAPGDLVDVSAAETFDLPLRLQTTPWGTADVLEVYVGGERVSQIAPDAAAEAIITVETTLTIDAPAEDSYLVAVTWSDDRLTMVAPGERTTGFTNPVYLDADGDGEWTPPGVDGEADLVRLDVSWCD